MMSRHRAFELYDRLRLAFSWESGICIRDIAHFHQLAADCGSGGRWFESTQCVKTSRVKPRSSSASQSFLLASVWEAALTVRIMRRHTYYKSGGQEFKFFGHASNP